MRTVKPLLLKSDAGDVYDILITTLENTTAEVKFPLISLVDWRGETEDLLAATSHVWTTTWEIQIIAYLLTPI